MPLLGKEESRPSQRYCPKCDRPMQEHEARGVEIDICPGCRGTWFEAGELPRAAGLRFEDDPQPRHLAEARRTDFRCPSCAIPLYERELGAEGGVQVDQCVQCNGLFLDKGEYAALRRHFATSGGRPPPPAKNRPAPSRPNVVDADSGGLVILQYLTGIPLEVGVPQVMFPPVVVTLLALNVAVLVCAYALGFRDSLDALAMLPARIVRGERLHTLLTSMFMHIGPLHLIGNMLFLYILGDDLEGRFGPWRFVVFYLACGLVAGLAFAFFGPRADARVVGASGAVSGVLGAYLVLWPRRRLLVRWFYLWWKHVRFEVPVWAYLGFWILVQFLFAAAGVPGVAWVSHVAGFLCGAAVALIARLR